MPDNKEMAKGRYRALAFVKGESMAKEKDLDVKDNELQTWPYLVRKEFLAAIIMMIILMVWSILLDAPLEEPSDPSISPNPAKAPWYFLGLQEMLVYFDPWIAGVVFPSLIVVGLMAIPYIDINPKGNGYYTFKDQMVRDINVYLWVPCPLVFTYNSWGLYARSGLALVLALGVLGLS